METKVLKPKSKNKILKEYALDLQFKNRKLMIENKLLKIENSKLKKQKS